MKRSQKELSALESAFKICCLVEEQSANVLAGADKYEDTEADMANNNRAIEYNNWYIKTIAQAKTTKKKELAIPDVIERMDLECDETLDHIKLISSQNFNFNNNEDEIYMNGFIEAMEYFKSMLESVR